MAFKKILSALVFALSLVKGQNIIPDYYGACSNLSPIIADLQQNLFFYECDDNAHLALRLAFHDAIGISSDPTIAGGGADGSIAVFNSTELQDGGNAGLDVALNDLAPYFSNYGYLLSPGDIIQLAAAVSLSGCTGAPQVSFVMGRPQPTVPATPGLVPGPQQSVTDILARMADAGFSPQEVVSVLAAHSIAGVNDIDPTASGAPLDSTPTVFDTQFYLEVLLHGTQFAGSAVNTFGEALTAVDGTFRFQSDDAFARDPNTACIWQSLINDEYTTAYNFAAGLFKISLLGQSGQTLIDCSSYIPVPPAYYGQASFPPTFDINSIDLSCPTSPFPSLSTDPGPAISVAPVPKNQ